MIKNIFLETQKEYMENLAIEFYDFLKKNNYFKKIPKFDPEIEQLILDRRKYQFASNDRIFILLNESNLF